MKGKLKIKKTRFGWMYYLPNFTREGFDFGIGWVKNHTVAETVDLALWYWKNRMTII